MAVNIKLEGVQWIKTSEEKSPSTNAIKLRTYLIS
jgi:hypothetical protein